MPIGETKATLGAQTQRIAPQVTIKYEKRGVCAPSTGRSTDKRVSTAYLVYEYINITISRAFLFSFFFLCSPFLGFCKKSLTCHIQTR